MLHVTGRALLNEYSPHTVQSNTTRCGVSRVGHAAKRPRLYRSDTDFTFTGSNLSRLPLDNNNVAIVKKRKKTKKRKKRKIWGKGCFGERPNPKITTSLFDFLANGSAALLALANPRPGFLQQARIFIHGLAGPKQHLHYFCDCDWPRATAPVVLC